MPKPVFFPDQGHTSSERPRQAIPFSIFHHTHIVLSVEGFLCTGPTGWETGGGAPWWRRRGCSAAYLKGPFRRPDRVTASWLVQTDPVLALNVPPPKKHLSPGQIRTVVLPQDRYYIPDLPESRGSRERGQVLHLCRWLMPLFYGFRKKIVCWDNILVFFPSSAFHCSQPAPTPTPK